MTRAIQKSKGQAWECKSGSAVLVTLDVKNAFNTVRWEKVMGL